MKNSSLSAWLGLGVMFAALPATAAGDGPFCRLSGEAMRERLGAIRTGLLENVVAVDELPDGYRFWVPRSEANLRRLADFVWAESDCCRFFDFEIALGREQTRASLAVTGSPEAKKMIAAMLHSVSFDLPAALAEP